MENDTINVTLSKKEVAWLALGFVHNPEPELKQIKDCTAKQLYEEYLTARKMFAEGELTVKFVQDDDDE